MDGEKGGYIAANSTFDHRAQSRLRNIGMHRGADRGNDITFPSSTCLRALSRLRRVKVT